MSLVTIFTETAGKSFENGRWWTVSSCNFAFPLFKESLDEKLSHQRYMRCIQGGSNMTGTCAACLHTNQSRSYLNHLVFYNALFFQLFMFSLFWYGSTSYADAVHCLSIMTSLLCHSVHLYSRHCTLFFTRWLLSREENTGWLCQQKEKFTHGEKVMMGNWGMATEGIFCTPDVASIWFAAVSFICTMWQLVKKL
jgi:hypothetical protein